MDSSPAIGIAGEGVRDFGLGEGGALVNFAGDGEGLRDLGFESVVERSAFCLFGEKILNNVVRGPSSWREGALDGDRLRDF
jgi:hypothetical protein